jgi:hypothetical protein
VPCRVFAGQNPFVDHFENFFDLSCPAFAFHNCMHIPIRLNMKFRRWSSHGRYAIRTASPETPGLFGNGANLLIILFQLLLYSVLELFINIFDTLPTFQTWLPE